MAFGYDWGVLSAVLVMPQFLERFSVVGDNAPGAGFWKGLLTTMNQLGALVAALNQSWIAAKISRKYSIVAAVIILVVVSFIQTVFFNYSMFSIGRLTGGIGNGMLSMAAPLHICEISPPEIRRALLILEELSVVAGMIVASWITHRTRYIDGKWAWRLQFLLRLAPGLILGIGVWLLPFSSRWLTSKGHNDVARQSLRKLRRLPMPDSIQQEWLDIFAKVEFHKEISALKHPHLQGNNTRNCLRLVIASWTDCL